MREEIIVKVIYNKGDFRTDASWENNIKTNSVKVKEVIYDRSGNIATFIIDKETK